MRGVTASFRHEVLCVRRAKIPQLLLAIFIGMVAASSFIGWSARSTVTAVYQQIRADGLTKAPNPFSGTSPLFYSHNAVIYVVLIGALMAIVLGAQATIRDRKAATHPLVLSRPVGSPARLIGQAAALSAVMATVLALSAIISWVSISAISGSLLGPGESGGLLLFWAFSWAFLSGFALLGMLGGLYCSREATALLAPFIVWSVIAFVLPHLGTAARPVALLNPVPAVPAQDAGAFGSINLITGPFAVNEQFKQAAGLALHDSSVTGNPGMAITVLTLFVVLLGILVARVPRPRLGKALND